MRSSTKVVGGLLAGAISASGLLVYVVPSEATASGGAENPPRQQARSSLPKQELAQDKPVGTTLPGGATSLSEGYSDWQVVCGPSNAGKHCAMLQNQVQKNGQRVLAIELTAPSEGAINGIIALPFGLALESGATLDIDASPAGSSLRFRTCLPAGCILPLSFDIATLKALRTGTALKVKANADGGGEQAFSISLKGFAAALDRLNELTR